MIKELALQTIQELPENVTVSELLDAIMVRLCAEKGIDDIKNGNYISQEEFLKEVNEW